jgi:predicted ATPase
LGREFDYELLAAVVTVNEETLQAELAKLVSAGILCVKGQPPACTYAFKHALLEEALHGAIEEPKRRRFHQQVAEIMEEGFPRRAIIPCSAFLQPDMKRLSRDDEAHFSGK